MNSKKGNTRLRESIAKKLLLYQLEDDYGRDNMESCPYKWADLTQREKNPYFERADEIIGISEEIMDLS